MLLYNLFYNYGFYLVKNCMKGILSIHLKYNNLMLVVDKDAVQHICNFLKNHTNAQYHTLIDIIVVDYPFKKKRFEIIYNLLSISRNTRLFLKCHLSSLDTIYSVTSIYSAAS